MREHGIRERVGSCRGPSWSWATATDACSPRPADVGNYNNRAASYVDFNRVTSLRQPGSAMKPIVYLAAFGAER